MPTLKTLRYVAMATDTHYQHTSDIDPARGKFYTDCSGFVTWLLQRTEPSLVQAVRRFNHVVPEKRLRAWQYHDYFDAAPLQGQPSGADAFTQITRAADLVPGDIIATKNPRSEPNSGHMMVVVGAPRAVVRNGRTVAYTVRIADSTETPHQDDSRRNGTTGVGTGTIALGVDARGQITGYYRHGYDPGGPSLIDHDIEAGKPVDRIAVGRPHGRDQNARLTRSALA